MRPQTAEPRSFTTALCFGEIDEQLILPYPKTRPQDKELLKTVIGGP